MPDTPEKGDLDLITYDALVAGEGKIAVVGLGYVGLPLAVHLADYFDVVGFDWVTITINKP